MEVERYSNYVITLEEEEAKELILAVNAACEAFVKNNNIDKIQSLLTLKNELCLASNQTGF
jgi:hypothetical protein